MNGVYIVGLGDVLEGSRDHNPQYKVDSFMGTMFKWWY
jgi:hypothetical protein